MILGKNRRGEAAESRMATHSVVQNLDVFLDSCLGFTVSKYDARLKVSEKALKALKERVRKLSRRTRGNTIGVIIAELKKTLLGWRAISALPK